MANTFAPFGFRQFGTLEGNSPTYGLTRRYLASSDTNLYFTGDVVALSTFIPGFITLPASGISPTNPILGIFAGCEFFSPSVGRVVWSSFFPGNTTSGPLEHRPVVTRPRAFPTLHLTRPTSRV